MTNAIQFWLGDTRHTLDPANAGSSLLDWLRTARNRPGQSRTGTKEGCNEGDCGACTVIAIRLNPDGRTLNWMPLNACIQYMFMLADTQILTIEDLKTADTLHPMQTAMIERGGSQCGFCTPGFVMAMTAAAASGTMNGPTGSADALSGNLCRCTGYAPILAALTDATPDTTAWAETLTPTIRTRLAALDRTTPTTLQTPALRVDIPRTADQLATLYAEHPDATLLAGATDIGIWINKGGRTLPHIILTTLAADLQTPTEDTTGLTIPAGVTWAQALPALIRALPDAAPTLKRLGGQQVRAAGTVCGNIANGSPIGDGPPLLIAADATLTLRHGPTRRTIPLEAFFLAYGKQDRHPGEFVESVHIPKQPENSLFRAWKISKRHDQDISALLCAARLTRNGDTITTARIAFGGMAATPKRASLAETTLTNTTLDTHTLRAAQDAIAKDFDPISDFRASRQYRLTTAANLLARLHAALHGTEEHIHA